MTSSTVPSATTRPPCRRATRSAYGAAALRSCSDGDARERALVDLAPDELVDGDGVADVEVGRRPRRAAGSGASCARARAMATRFCSPPESSATRPVGQIAELAGLEGALDGLRRSAAVGAHPARPGAARGPSSPPRAPRSRARPRPLRHHRDLRAIACAIEGRRGPRPTSATRPRARRQGPERSRTSVDLPAPLGPRTAQSSPATTSGRRRASTSSSPYAAGTPGSSTATAVTAARAGRTSELTRLDAAGMRRVCSLRNGACAEGGGGGPIATRYGDGEGDLGTGEKPRRVIKRYSNRKLYDTKDSRYVTLQQIGEMVRAGEEVQIIDNATKEDKTEVTLALIISEDLKSQPRSRPARHAARSDPGARRAAALAAPRGPDRPPHPRRRRARPARPAAPEPAPPPAPRRAARGRAAAARRRRRRQARRRQGAPHRDRRELEAHARPVAAHHRSNTAMEVYVAADDPPVYSAGASCSSAASWACGSSDCGSRNWALAMNSFLCLIALSVRRLQNDGRIGGHPRRS